MGNACVPARRYHVLAGDEGEQETTFSTASNVREEMEASRSAHDLLVQSHAQDLEDHTQAQTQAEATYDMAVDSLKLERSDSLENLLTCAICLDFMYEPVRSICNHSFCRGCLRRLLEFDGANASCPKCRASFAKMDPDKLVVDVPLAETIQRSVERDELSKRQEEAELDEREYKDARALRLRREHLMETNPLQLMFESEEDPMRRRILRRDMALLTGLGFSEVMAQKALFVSSGTHTEALSWLIHHQHHPHIDEPWNATQLQEQIALRNTRRVMCGIEPGSETRALIPGKLVAAINTVRHVSILGRKAWLIATRGFQALNMPEIVFLLKQESEERVIPDALLKLIRSLFMKAEQGIFRTDHATVVRITPEGDGFLGNVDIKGVLLTREMGQNLQGIPMPIGDIVLGILLIGAEATVAETFPVRFLLQLGRNHRGNYPFPVINDRFRDPTPVPQDESRYLQSALFMKDSLCMRVRAPLEPQRPRFRRQTRRSWFLLHLPVEGKAQLRRYLECWTSSTSFPILCDFPLGSDGFLLCHTRNSRQKMLSLASAEGCALGAVGITIVRDRHRVGTGGILHMDTLMFYASEQNFNDIRQALLLGHDVEMPPSSRRLESGLRIKWLPAALIRSGFSHISADVFPSRQIFPFSHIVGNVSQGLVELVASETREMICPQMHPRISVLGIGIGLPTEVLEERISRPDLEQYLKLLLESVNTKLGKLLTDTNTTAPPSIITLHIDIKKLEADHDDDEHCTVMYRISKNYGETCPQAPSLSMRKWSRMLHPLPAPPATGHVPLRVFVQLQ
eukprot:m.164485 g.164485  ORF g.164485 m.164485 type:complete len:799 (+) comp16409_c3_seq1:1350-3746(+)